MVKKVIYYQPGQYSLTAGLFIHHLMDYPIIKISAYKAWKGKPGCVPYDTDFYSEMRRIGDGSYADIVRKYRSIADRDERLRYKIDQLPSLTISALCHHWRKLENVVSHSGLLNLDIDKKSNQHITDWPALRDQIFEMPGVVCSFLSVSGEGVTFVVRIAPEQHKDAFFSIVDGAKQLLGINIDPGLHDVVRLRFVSDDPGIRIRYNLFDISISAPSYQYLQSKRGFGSATLVLEPTGTADSEQNFLEAVKKATLFYQFVDGQKWSILISIAGTCNVMGMSEEFCRAMVLKHFRSQTTIDDGRLLSPVNGVYKLYRAQHGTFNIEAAFERLNYRLKRHIIFKWLHEGKRPTPEEILDICKEFEANKERVEATVDRVWGEYASEFGYNKFEQVVKVQTWLGRRYAFRLNVVSGQPEYSELGSTVFETVNEDEIYRQLQISSMKYSLANVKSLMRSAFIGPYDPIADYFSSLTWDGLDHITRLAGHVTTEDYEFWEKQLRKSLVRSIACGLGTKENRIVMVLYGERQETGKSTFIRWLSPWGVGQYFTESPIIGGNAKDTEIRFSENFIYNIEELAGLDRHDINKLKADISKSVIKERRAYGVYEVTRVRRCNFWASTNQREFLHDDENSRWLVFNCRAIDWSYKTTVNIHQVWAQAYQLYKDGYNSDLDVEDRLSREYLNQDYRFTRPEEDLILRHFKPADSGSCKFWTCVEIAMYLNSLSNSLRINHNNIGKTIRKIWGLNSIQVKVNGRNTRGYWLAQVFSSADGETAVGWAPVTG